MTRDHTLFHWLSAYVVMFFFACGSAPTTSDDSGGDADTDADSDTCADEMAWTSIASPSSPAAASVSVAQGTLSLRWISNFAAPGDVADYLIARGSLAVDGFDLYWSGTEVDGASVRFTNSATVLRRTTRHLSGATLDIHVHWGGTPTRTHLVVNGVGRMGPNWPDGSNAPAFAAFTPSDSITGFEAGGVYSWLGVSTMRDTPRVLAVVVGDSISLEPYVSNGADQGWCPILGSALAVHGSYVLAEAMSGRTFAAWTQAETDLKVRDQGATHVIVMLGVNDLTGGDGTTLAQLQADSQALYTRMKGYGCKVFACTITPIGFSGATEIIRNDFNDWLLAYTPTNIDLVIDVDTAVADPAVPNTWLDAYRDADHIHPNAAGQIVVGDTVVAAFAEN